MDENRQLEIEKDDQIMNLTNERNRLSSQVKEVEVDLQI